MTNAISISLRQSAIAGIVAVALIGTYLKMEIGIMLGVIAAISALVVQREHNDYIISKNGWIRTAEIPADHVDPSEVTKRNNNHPEVKDKK